MVDAKARKVAVEAIRSFRDCRISNLDFEEQWPWYDENDRALFAIETMLRRFYDDSHEHKLDGRHALTPAGRDILDRCVLFLETELEYKWPKDDFMSNFVVGAQRRRHHPGLVELCGYS